MTVEKTKVLMIGPRYKEGFPVGGTVALFELCLAKLSDCPELAITFVSTRRKNANRFRQLLESILITFHIWVKIPFCDVVFLFVATSSLSTSLKWISPVTRFLGKRLVVKKFGGRSHRELKAQTGYVPTTLRSPSELHNIISLLRRANLYMPETRHASEHGISDGIPTIWVPNLRELPQHSTKERQKTPRKGFSLLYVGIVMPEKGIREIIAADPLLKPGITIDVYGGFQGMSLDDFAELKQVRYCGELKKEDVIPTMQQYDAFIFPSYHSGEGHPGALIEAFAAGLPAITTNWLFICEVASDENSLIIETQNVTQLVEAIHRLAGDPELRETLAKNALERSRFFDADRWVEVIRTCIVSIAKGEAVSDQYHVPGLSEPVIVPQKL